MERNAIQPAAAGRRVIGPGQILVLLGTLAVIVSIFLNWIDVSIGPFTISTTSSGVPLQFHQFRAPDFAARSRATLELVR